MKRFEKFFVALAVGLFGFTAGAPAQADLNLSQSPLFLIAPVKPALIMGIDDSGSMDGELIMPTNDGAMWWHTGDDSFTGRGVTADGQNDTNQPGRLNFNAAGGANGTWKKYVYLFPNGSDGSNGFRRRYNDSNNDHYAVPPIPAFAYARSPRFNAIYFDPSEEYPPFPSEGADTFSDANPTSASYDEARGNGTINLTVPMRSDDNNWVFRMYEGMTLPAGTVVREADSNACEPIDENPFDNSWTPLASDTPIEENNCAVAIEYFPATFWLPASEAPPASFGFDLSKRISGGLTPDGQPMLGYEIKPGNFTSTAAYSDAIQSFANWFSYYRKRSLLTRAALGRSFEEVNFLRTGFFRINNRGDVTMRDLGDADDREEFFDWQYDLRGNGGTPNRESVKHIGEQFDNQSGANAPILEACQRNFGMLVTDGFSNAWTSAGVGNTDGPGVPAGEPAAFGTVLSDNESNTMADIAYRYYNTHLRAGQIAGGKVPVPSACSQANPPLDLDCVEDPHMNLFAVALGAKGLVFGVDEAATADPYANPPTWPTGFQNRNPTAIDDLWHATLNTRGQMFSATNPAELVDALTSVLREIASRIEPVGVSATSTRLDENTQFFESELDSTTWSGNLRAIDANDGSVNWNAEDALPVSRTIKTSIGGASADFTTSAAVRDAIFGTTSTLSENDQNSIINYLRGDQSDEQPDGPLRERDGVIGDIANSRPTFVGPINEGWGRLDNAAGGSYLGYVNGGKQNLNLVLVGANDGMLHAFDSDSGVEQFAYIPSMVHKNLAQLADPDYVHRFYVDGQIGIGDIHEGGWDTVAVAGLGAGGKGVFALDLENGQPLWEIDTDHPDVGEHIGHVFGKPVITRAGGEWVAIFGNGYNSEEGKAGLIVAPMDGGTVEFIETNDVTDNGLSEVAVFMDPVDSVNVLRAYAGDLKGNMWRFDFDGGTFPVSEFGSSPLIQVDDNRAITSAPTLAALPGGGIMVFFGTGKLLETADRVGTASAFDTFYAARDRNNALNTSMLEQATMTSEDGGRSISGVDNASDGWKLDLGIGSNVTGERVLAKPAVNFGRLIFTTFEPDDDPCSPGGIRRIYLLNALNASGQFETDNCVNCGVIEVGLGAPIDPAIIIRPPGDADQFDDDNPPPPFNPGDGTLPDGSTVGSVTRWCSTLLIQVAGQGQVPIGNVCDGRQVWRQAR